MTLQECYAAMGADYGDVRGRLPSEGMIQKYVLKFLDDVNFDALCRGLAEGTVEEAFRAAHTLKGTCLTLGFTKLANSASQMTEALRGGDLAGAAALLKGVQEDYTCTVNAIRVFKESVLA